MCHFFVNDYHLVLFCAQKIGEEWVTDLSLLQKLLPLATNDAFMKAVYKVKQVRFFVDSGCMSSYVGGRREARELSLSILLAPVFRTTRPSLPSTCWRSMG